MKTTIIQGDSRRVLSKYKTGTFDSVVIDPPYELTSIRKRFGSEDAVPAGYGTDGAFARASRGFMGKTWDGSGIAFDPSYWAEVLRVLKPGGYMVSFGGTRTYHRVAVAIEDAGFEIRDSINWIYGSGFPKSKDIGKEIDRIAGAEREIVAVSRRGAENTGTEAVPFRRPGSKVFNITAPATDAAKIWNGWGTALKPAHEPIILARKTIAASSVAANVLQYGAGAININGSTIKDPELDQLSDALQLQRIGRWPANVILTHSPDCTFDGMKRVKGDNGTAPTETKTGGIWNDSTGHPAGRAYGDQIVEAWTCTPDCPVRLIDESPGSETPSRFFATFDWRADMGDPDLGDYPPFLYIAKASSRERDAGLDDLPVKSGGELTHRKEGSAGLNSPRAGAGRSGGRKNTHPTVKPIGLMEYLIRLVTPPGGHVLDPMMGSGTTVAAASRLGFDVTGIDLEDEYIPIARRRVPYWAKTAGWMAGKETEIRTPAAIAWMTSWTRPETAPLVLEGKVVDVTPSPLPVPAGEVPEEEEEEEENGDLDQYRGEVFPHLERFD